MKKILVILIIISSTAFHRSANPNQPNADKNELLKMEKEFSDYVQQEGIAAGFAKYAAPDAVVNRNGNLISGRDKINEFYNQARSKKDKLSWTADFADVSASGDLGYTYGKYIYVAYDSAGNTKEYKGIFHTVWKRQKDGSWKFVYD
ncbi:MAG: nuclear transport factor 2 family protein [Bacteroidetes bacterium]|nr:nuclear transport factor 2 family protein [Bacteroidota bacterium]